MNVKELEKLFGQEEDYDNVNYDYKDKECKLLKDVLPGEKFIMMHHKDLTYLYGNVYEACVSDCKSKIMYRPFNKKAKNMHWNMTWSVEDSFIDTRIKVLNCT